MPILPQNVEELQRRVVRAESSLSERERENTALRDQIRQFEMRWSEYETKMKAVEEMWQTQMASLQVSFILCFFFFFLQTIGLIMVFVGGFLHYR